MTLLYDALIFTIIMMSGIFMPVAAMTNNFPPPDPRSAGLLEIRALALHAGPPNGRGGIGQEQLPHDDNSSGNDASWQASDMSLLEDRRGDLPSFPVDALGPVVGAALERTAKGAGV